MSPLYLLPLLAVLLTAPAHAQNPIADLGGSTSREKNVYAVYDLRGADIRADVVQDIVLSAIRRHARDAQVREGIVPQPYPAYPGQMTIGQRLSGGPKPECAGEVFSIEGIDSSMARYGEKTYHRACLFPYAGGYRINYYAIYVQQSGAGSGNPNVLSAMLGRAMGSLVGLGDSGTFINKVLGGIESGLQGAGIAFKLVQLQPTGLPDRVVVADDLVPPTQAQPVTSAPVATPTPARSVATTLPDGRPMPPELVQMQAAMVQQRELLRQQMAAQPRPETTGRTMTAIEARKELTAMGLQYYNQDQFVAAIRRGDTLAVDLFIAGEGVDLNAGSPGLSPVAVAEAGGKSEIAAKLRARGAR